jgi:hypothetical protein
MTTVQTSSRQVNGAIKAVRTSADKYNKNVQTAIELIIAHADLYGDCTGAGRLLEAMPRSNRRSLVISHFADYSPINVRKGKEGEGFTATLRKQDDTKYKPFNLEGVKANLWHMRPEAQTLPDTVTYQTVIDDFDKFCQAEHRKGEKVKAEADAMDDGPTKANRMADANAIFDFVADLRKAFKAAAKAPRLVSDNTDTDEQAAA